MEPVSLAVGIVSAIQACCDGYAFIRSIGDGPTILARTRCKFEIERARFFVWARRWGFVDEKGIVSPASVAQERLTAESDAIVKLLHSILSEIAELLSDGEKFKHRYSTRPTAEAQSDEGFAITPGAHGFPKDAKTELLGGQPKLSITKRLSWSVRDRESFLRLVVDLREFNNGLFALVPTLQRNFLSEALTAEILTTKNDRDELQNIQEAISPNDSCLQTAVAMKSLSLEANALPADAVLPPLRLKAAISAVVLSGDALPDTEADQWAFATFSQLTGNPPTDSQVPVLVEWKPYNFRVTGAKAFTVALRADTLARLLYKFSPISGLATLPCLGYVEDVSRARFGFIFECPPTQLFGYPQQPRSLNSIIEQTPALPSLETRFRLATKLATTLFKLHCASWLHRSFSSYEILFANTAETQHHPNLAEPLLLGFNYSRPEDHEGLSSETRTGEIAKALLYKHPFLLGHLPNQGRRFCRSFDIYSLGCVLLEIGLWRTLGALWKPKYLKHPDSWTRRLVEVWARELSGRCGGIYEDVVRKCLTVDVSEATDEPKVLMAFCWDVLRQLEGLKV